MPPLFYAPPRYAISIMMPIDALIISLRHDAVRAAIDALMSVA